MNQVTTFGNTLNIPKKAFIEKNFMGMFCNISSTLFRDRRSAQLGVPKKWFSDVFSHITVTHKFDISYHKLSRSSSCDSDLGPISMKSIKSTLNPFPLQVCPEIPVVSTCIKG